MGVEIRLFLVQSACGGDKKLREGEIPILPVVSAFYENEVKVWLVFGELFYEPLIDWF